MRDAIGGLLNVQLVAVFIVLISGYLAFSVNYTKAFRAKNKLISLTEQYEGNMGSVNDAASSYFQKIGYNPNPGQLRQVATSGSGINCEFADTGFCYKKNTVEKKDTGIGYRKEYYTIYTTISIDIPVIRNIIPSSRLFTVSGDTKTIFIRG